MNHSNKAALLGLCSVVWVVAGAFGAASLPYTNSMAYPLSDGNWSPTAVTSSGGPGVQDANTISFTNDLTLSITPVTHSNCSVTVYAKVAHMNPTAVPAAATAADVACAFYVDTGSNLIARSASTWTTQAVGIAFGTNDWVGFRVHVNTSTKKWDLYYVKNEYTNSLTPANASPMDCNSSFVANSIGVTSVTVSSELPAQLDYVVAAKAFSQPGPTEPAEVMVFQQQTVTAGQGTVLQLIGNTYTAGDNTLAGSSLGEYVQSLCVAGDRVDLVVAGGSVSYTNDGATWHSFPPLAYPNASTVSVTPGMALVLTPATTRTIEGYAYPDPKNVQPTVLHGKGSGSGGISLLAWQAGKASSAVNSTASRWGFAGGVAKGGDTIYAQDINNSTNYKAIFWNVAQGKWKEGASDASGFVMTENQPFYYFRPFSTDNGSWTNQTAQ